MITIVLALIIAFIWGLGELNYKKLTSVYDSFNILFYLFLFEIISFIIFVLVFDVQAFSRFNARIFIYIIPILIISSALGSSLYLYSMKNANLSIISPILASDPVYTVIIGIMFFKEKLSITSLILLIIICASICALNFVSSNTKQKTKKIAIFLASLYAFLVAITTTLEKSIYLNGFKITDFYFHYAILLTILVFFMLIFMKIKNIRLKKPDKNLILTNAYTRSGYFLHSYLLSTSYISIVAPLTGLYSVVTHILAIIILKEKLTLIQRICVILIIISTILLLIFSS